MSWASERRPVLLHSGAFSFRCTKKLVAVNWRTDGAKPFVERVR
jgi:hypothetical protein